MKQQASAQFETQAVQYLKRAILLEEEHHPLPDDPQPAVLVARVSERLHRAQTAIRRYERARDDAGLQQVAAHLTAASAFAVSAIVHMHPVCWGVEPTYLKDELLRTIDNYVAEVISGDELFGSATIDDLLEPCSNDLCRAFESISEDDSHEALERAAVALWNVANAATVAAADVAGRRTERAPTAVPHASRA